MGTIHKLEDIQLDEISLVDRGSNPGAEVLFSKRDTSGVDADEFIFKRASVKGDAPVTPKEKSQMQKTEQEAGIKKALTGGSSRNEINELITTLVGKKDTVNEQATAESEFMKTPVGIALQTAHDAAPAQAPPAKIEKKAVGAPIGKAEQTLNSAAANLKRHSKNKLTDHQAYTLASTLAPQLGQDAIDGEEPDADDVAKLDSQIAELTAA